MSWNDQINRILKWHDQGAYTRLELLPLLIKNTPQEHLGDLKSLLPVEIWLALVEWIHDYPLHGGIQIRDGESLPIEKIIWLKQQTQDER